MLVLITELSAAKNLLEVALDRYLDACAAIQSYYSECGALAAVPKVLSDCVAGEVDSVSTYELKIQQAQSIISQARNCSVTLAPIHVLPSEILARIFPLVVGDSCGVGVDDSKSRAMPRYPDFLSHACSRWRNTALDLPELWTHIDLVYYHSSSRNYVDRAEVFVARARQLPLDVHIRIPVSPDYHSGPEVMYEFLSSIMKRIVSLALGSPKTIPFAPNAGFYEFLFNNLEPLGLLRLSITDHSPGASDFMYAEEDIEGIDDNTRLAVTRDRLEALLLHVKFLRLNGIYFRWTSQAYHGLVELHLDQLLSRNRKASITVSELWTILASTPKLAILHFALEIVDDPDGGHIVPPVLLEDLEVLNLQLLLEQVHVEQLLFLLVPGLKPLQLTIRLKNAFETISDPDSPITKFLKHSNLVRLCIGGRFQHCEIGALLALLPRLHVLALMEFHCVYSQATLPKPSEHSPPLMSPQVDTIYFHGGHYYLDYLDHLVKAYSIQSVVVWKTAIYQVGKALRGDDLMAELSARRPVFRHVDALESNPIEWGFQV